ncbi:hypothetical protein B0A48_03812 [Cryoendolithus antarcticus]|uniref:F-box domain-containing protein n=1 Tax=Cryoendolithus antarcticus TaxID=1507870 RepID=A0A1V8TGL7_9PEZI|nr:hypothetical protein B0A48_03812 [Cryoendolithus antarcticus]
MAATDAVLGIPELLGNILLQLDSWKEPFVLLRVSRTFKATIEDSKQLQHKMWLLPQATHPPGVPLWDGLNPLLGQLKLRNMDQDLSYRPAKGAKWWVRVALAAHSRMFFHLGIRPDTAAQHTSQLIASDDTFHIGSWRRTKCCSMSGFAAVVVIGYSSRRGFGDDDDIDFDVTRDMTLGELLDELHAITGRVDANVWRDGAETG